MLDALPTVEKTSLFGTAVHAVLRDARHAAGRRWPTRCAAAGIEVQSHRPRVAVARGRVPRRGRTGRRRRPDAHDAGRRARRSCARSSRDRRTLLILLFVPAFFLLLYGYALNFDIRNIRLAVQDRDRSTQSRELVSAFVNSGYFDLVGYVDSDARDRSR